MACTEAEWLQWLPRAVGEHAYVASTGSARVTLARGELQLQWQVLPPRVIALMRMPRLSMKFEFQGAPDAARLAFMKRFDLYTQRGGG